RRASCSTARLVPVRRCSRVPSPVRRASRSSRSRDLISSRCSSASAPRACATSSSRRSKRRPASCSWTRSTPSAAIVARASAAATPGFTGADLANLVNEAALLAARRGKKTIQQEELEEGIMRVIAGPEKKTRLFSEEERRITAYHELGHAIVGYYLDQESEVH